MLSKRVLERLEYTVLHVSLGKSVQLLPFQLADWMSYAVQLPSTITSYLYLCSKPSNPFREGPVHLN